MDFFFLFPSLSLPSFPSWCVMHDGARWGNAKNKYRRVFINKQRNIETGGFFLLLFAHLKSEYIDEADDELLTFKTGDGDFSLASPKSFCVNKFHIATVPTFNFFFSGRLRWKSFISDYINWSLPEWMDNEAKQNELNFLVNLCIVDSELFFVRNFIYDVAKSRDFRVLFLLGANGNKSRKFFMKSELISSSFRWYIYAQGRGACADWIIGFSFFLLWGRQAR